MIFCFLPVAQRLLLARSQFLTYLASPLSSMCFVRQVVLWIRPLPNLIPERRLASDAIERVVVCWNRIPRAAAERVELRLGDSQRRERVQGGIYCRPVRRSSNADCCARTLDFVRIHNTPVPRLRIFILYERAADRVLV